MPISETTGAVIAPVSITDIKRAIGAGSYELSVLCKHTNINKYSKYKPMKIAGNAVTDNDRRNANWGYVVPNVKASLIALINYINGGAAPNGLTQTGDGLVELKNFWYYQRPTGGASSPYRQGDFENYKANVPNELFTLSAGHDSGSSDIIFNISSQGGSYQLQLSDLDSTNFSGMMFAVAVYKVGATISGNTVKFIANTEYPIPHAKCGTLKVEGENFSKLFPSNGQYRLIPFLTSLNDNFTVAQNATQAQHILLPTDPITFNITDAGSTPVTPDQVEFRLTVDYDAVFVQNKLLKIPYTLEARSKTASLTFNRNLYYQVTLANMDNSDTYSTVYTEVTPSTRALTSTFKTISTGTLSISLQPSGHNFTDSFKWILIFAYDKSGHKLSCDTTGFNIMYQ